MGSDWHTAPPPSTRVTIVGRTGSGKSSALLTLFAERYPRVVVLDHLGTQWPAWKGAQVVYRFGDAVRWLRTTAPKARRWRLVCCFPQESEDVEQLFQLLAPDPRLGGGFPKALGGVALLSDELVKVAHTSCPAIVRDAWSNGRHVGLTILGATQRPSQVARIVTASTEWLGVCQQHEPLDMEVVAAYLSPDAMREVEQLPRFGLVLYNTSTGRGMVLHSPAKGQYVQVRELGAPESPRKPRPKTKPVPPGGAGASE